MSKSRVSGTGISVISLLSPYLRASPMFLSLSALPSPHSSLRPRQVITATTLQQTTRNTETFCPTKLFQQKNKSFVTKYLFSLHTFILCIVYYVYCISWVYKGTKKFTYKYNLCVNSSWKETFLQSIMRNEGVFFGLNSEI